MCGKLPTGSPGLVPSGRAPAASGSGVPHQGGASVTALAPPAQASADAIASATSPSRTALLSLFDMSPPPSPEADRKRLRRCAPPCAAADALAPPSLAGRAFIDDLP